MALPAQLAQRMREALEAVHRHPAHDLNLGHREAIWAALGPREVGGTGHKRRAVLALLAAGRVLPLWRDVQLPEEMVVWELQDADPRRVLTIALRVLDGAVDRAYAERATSSVFNTLNALAAVPGNEVPHFVGLSADRALATALSDERFDPDALNLSLTDAARDAWTYDATYFAAGAAADGPLTQPDTDAGKRRAFWEWWLTQAVPAAWEAVDLDVTRLDPWETGMGLTT